ncbi:MAG: metalloregulator ArsR/SmtB family transcription factor [Bacteroidia bacterium]|jgi:DNA-binding transcriptional ArsR family regulator
MRRDVFQAIADPTRRQIIGIIARKPMNLNTIAENFDVSRPAISKHIKILTECGLIIVKQEGRERYCEAQLDKLTEVSVWLEQYKKFWNQKLDALEMYLNALQMEEQPEAIAHPKAKDKTKSKLKKNDKRKSK